MENPIKMDDLGVPLFSETPISRDIFYVRLAWEIPMDLKSSFLQFHELMTLVIHPGTPPRNPRLLSQASANPVVDQPWMISNPPVTAVEPGSFTAKKS